MTGGTKVEMAKPNPAGEKGWLSDTTWAGILQVSTEFECFKGLDVSFEKETKEWERIYNLSNPQSEEANWPAPFDDITIIRKAIIMRLLRTDKVIPLI
jgi:hypothetical protein